MQKEKTIDYLQFTFPEPPDFLSGSPYSSKSPMPFYRLMYEYKCGTRVFYGNSQSPHHLIQMAGKACERWRMTDFMGRLELVLKNNCHFSRIDLAITVASAAPLQLFREAVKNGEVVSERYEQDKSKVIASGEGDVETVYVGSLKKRSKKGIFRAYNKAEELGLDIELTRFELEIRTKHADVAVGRLLEGYDIGDLIRAVVDVPGASWWEEIMGGKSETLPRYDKPPDIGSVARRWAWLMRQVAPTLGKLKAIDWADGSTDYDEFLKMVEKECAKHKRAIAYVKSKRTLN